MRKRLNEGEIIYTNELDALKAGLVDYYKNNDRVKFSIIRSPKMAIKVVIQGKRGIYDIFDIVYIFKGSDDTLKAKTANSDKLYRLIDSEAAFDLIDDLLESSVKDESKSRKSSRKLSIKESVGGYVILKNMNKI